MGKCDPKVDQYIEKSADFAKPILEHLRSLVHEACPEVEEAIKWNFPNFVYKGILCNMASFKHHCTFGFWKAPLILDSDVADEAMGQFGKITSISDLPGDSVMIGYIKKAVELNEKGIKVPKKASATKKKLDIPNYFMVAIRENESALRTFNSFSNSHKKEYVEWVADAKTEETRDKRLATTVRRLSEGKERNWKYTKK